MNDQCNCIGPQNSERYCPCVLREARKRGEDNVVPMVPRRYMTVKDEGNE